MFLVAYNHGKRKLQQLAAHQLQDRTQKNEELGTPSVSEQGSHCGEVETGAPRECTGASPTIEESPV